MLNDESKRRQIFVCEDKQTIRRCVRDIQKTVSLIVLMSHWGKEIELVMDNNGRTMG